MYNVYLPEVNNNRLSLVSSPANISAAVQGHRDLLCFHLVELHLDLVDAGCNGDHPCPNNTLPYWTLSC